jgi:hypothetical protein
MGKHENPQRPAEVFKPQGFPLPIVKHGPAVTTGGKEPDQAATIEDKEDLGDVIRAIDNLANELHDAFFAVPDVAENGGRVDPEKFDAATRLAFVSCGNALDYAIRLVTEKGRGLRIRKLRKELSEEMRAAGLTGDPADGESAS